MKIQFRHLFHKGHPFATVGVHYDEKSEAYYGTVAVCNRLDQFQYSVSRNIVRGRLQKYLATSKINNNGILVYKFKDSELDLLCDQLNVAVLYHHFPNSKEQGKIFDDIDHQLEPLRKSFEKK